LVPRSETLPSGPLHQSVVGRDGGALNTPLSPGAWLVSLCRETCKAKLDVRFSLGRTAEESLDFQIRSRAAFRRLSGTETLTPSVCRGFVKETSQTVRQLGTP
jgi:hypothetical protein